MSSMTGLGNEPYIIGDEPQAAGDQSGAGGPSVPSFTLTATPPVLTYPFPGLTAALLALTDAAGDPAASALAAAIDAAGYASWDLSALASPGVYAGVITAASGGGTLSFALSITVATAALPDGFAAPAQAAARNQYSVTLGYKCEYDWGDKEAVTMTLEGQAVFQLPGARATLFDGTGAEVTDALGAISDPLFSTPALTHTLSADLDTLALTAGGAYVLLFEAFDGTQRIAAEAYIGVGADYGA